MKKTQKVSTATVVEEGYFHTGNSGVTVRIIEHIDQYLSDGESKDSRPSRYYRYQLETQHGAHGSSTRVSTPLGCPAMIDYYIEALGRVKERINGLPDYRPEHAFSEYHTDGRSMHGHVSQAHRVVQRKNGMECREVWSPEIVVSCNTTESIFLGHNLIDQDGNVISFDSYTGEKISRGSGGTEARFWTEEIGMTVPDVEKAREAYGQSSAGKLAEKLYADEAVLEVDRDGAVKVISGDTNNNNKQTSLSLEDRVMISENMIGWDAEVLRALPVAISGNVQKEADTNADSDDFTDAELSSLEEIIDANARMLKVLKVEDDRRRGLVPVDEAAVSELDMDPEELEMVANMRILAGIDESPSKFYNERLTGIMIERATANCAKRKTSQMGRVLGLLRGYELRDGNDEIERKEARAVIENRIALALDNAKICHPQATDFVPVWSEYLNLVGKNNSSLCGKVFLGWDAKSFNGKPLFISHDTDRPLFLSIFETEDYKETGKK